MGQKKDQEKNKNSSILGVILLMLGSPVFQELIDKMMKENPGLQNQEELPDEYEFTGENGENPIVLKRVEINIDSDAIRDPDFPDIPVLFAESLAMTTSKKSEYESNLGYLLDHMNELGYFKKGGEILENVNEDVVECNWCGSLRVAKKEDSESDWFCHNCKNEFVIY